MTAKASKSEAERGYTKTDLEDVSEAPKFTADEMARAKLFAEAFPELATGAKRVRARQRAPTKQLISLRLDRTVIEAFKSESPGWQSRINEVDGFLIRSLSRVRRRLA